MELLIDIVELREIIEKAKNIIINQVYFIIIDNMIF